MAASRMPDALVGLEAGLIERPRLVFGVALTLSVVGAALIGSGPVGEAIVGGLTGWLLWLTGVTVLSAWLLLVLVGRPLTALLIAGLVAAVSGAVLFYNPTAGLLAVSILVISSLVMDGGVQLALALELRPASVWRWLFASALASAVAVIALSNGLPIADRGGWRALIGLALFSSGIALLIIGRSAPSRR